MNLRASAVPCCHSNEPRKRILKNAASSLCWSRLEPCRASNNERQGERDFQTSVVANSSLVGGLTTISPTSPSYRRCWLGSPSPFNEGTSVFPARSRRPCGSTSGTLDDPDPLMQPATLNRVRWFDSGRGHSARGWRQEVVLLPHREGVSWDSLSSMAWLTTELKEPQGGLRHCLAVSRRPSGLRRSSAPPRCRP
jgi:hypothetical protein